MVGEINCNCSDLQEINDFFSFNEFERFQEYLGNLVKSGELVEVQVDKPFAGFTEQWYKCEACSRVWRLVYPDFPFKGIWRLV